MSKLNAFFKRNKEKEVEFIVSEDFKNEDGTTRPFILRKLKGTEIFKIQEAATTISEKGIPKVNGTDLSANIMVACVEDPDLLNKELQDEYGVTTPHALLDEMLEGDEYIKLSRKCMDINGLSKTVQELQKEAKN